MKKTHLHYLSAIIILMLLTLILSSVLMFSIGKLNTTVNMVLILIYSSFTGYISAKVIEGITHKEKREVLAGSLIPLPTTIGMIIYIVTLNNLKFVETISPVWASAAFFIAFNIPFLIIFYEHKKHKHNLIGFTIAPLALAVVYLFAYVLTSFIATDFITPQVTDSFTLSYKVNPIKSYVENCLRSVSQEAVAKDEDIGLYIDSNLNNCIESFSPFKNLDIKAEDYSSEVIYGDSTITIKLNYPISFTKDNFNHKISDFQTTFER